MHRANLTVLTGALTTRVLVESGRAGGVEYRRDGQTHAVRTHGEVLLAGGAINSPQLLMLSGIGRAPHLRDAGVDVRHDVPGVGQGLQDHPAMPVEFGARGSSLKDAQKPKNVATFHAARRGPLTSNVGEAGAFLRSRTDLEHVDLQLFFAPVRYRNQGLMDPTGDAFTMAVTLVHVASRGALTLRSTDPTWAPAIDGGYLSEDVDLEALVAGVKQAREIARGGALGPQVTSEAPMTAGARSDEDRRRLWVRPDGRGRLSRRRYSARGLGRPHEPCTG